jgi:hypothetical protein
MSILVGPLIRTVDELDATCEGREDPVTYDELHIPAFEKSKKCYNVRTLADWLSQRSLNDNNKFKNTDPLSRSPFSAEERADIFRTTGRPDPSGGDATRWDTYEDEDEDEDEDDDEDDIRLINAAGTGNDLLVARWIQAGANVNAQDGEALISAASEGHDTVVAQLIAAGANVDDQESQALINAAGAGYDQVVARLIEAGAKVNAQDGQALIQATIRGHDTVVAQLIAAGARQT